MSKVTIELNKLREWQSKLDSIDGAMTIAEEMYDFIAKEELKLMTQEKKVVEKKLKSVTMREVVIGNDYRISPDTNFKDKYSGLKGATVRIVSKKRSKVIVTVMSTVVGFTGMNISIHVENLEKL